MSGDANFAMKHTGLTVGGFIQPSIARNLIEIPTNVEKGLCQRFLWLVPKPTSVPFEELQEVDKDFSTALSECWIIGNISDNWEGNSSVSAINCK